VSLYIVHLQHSIVDWQNKNSELPTNCWHFQTSFKTYFSHSPLTSRFSTPTSNCLCHAPISLCGVNLCTMAYQNLPDSNCSIARLLHFERRAGNCVQRWWTL